MTLYDFRIKIVAIRKQLAGLLMKFGIQTLDSSNCANRTMANTRQNRG